MTGEHWDGIWAFHWECAALSDFVLALALLSDDWPRPMATYDWAVVKRALGNP